MSGSGISWAICFCTSLQTDNHASTPPHTHPFNGPFSRTTQVGRYQKGKTNLDFTEARDSEWQWHQLGHMQVCTSLQADNHASTPPLSYLQVGCPSCRPTNSVRALKVINQLRCGIKAECLCVSCVICRCSDAASRPRAEHVPKRSARSSIHSPSSVNSPNYDSGYELSESSYKTSPSSKPSTRGMLLFSYYY